MSTQSRDNRKDKFIRKNSFCINKFNSTISKLSNLNQEKALKYVQITFDFGYKIIWQKLNKIQSLRHEIKKYFNEGKLYLITEE
jgi:hypothetical protein